VTVPRGSTGANERGSHHSGGVGTSPIDPASSRPVAIVTAATRGVGRQIAHELAGRGYAIVVVYLDDQLAAEATVGELLAAKAPAVAVRADLVDELDVERLFTETNAAFGRVDVVVHVTIRGAALVNQHAARELRRGGAIVSLFDADGITRDLAHELRARDVTINGVTPGVEPPGREHDIAELLAVLDRWRQGRESL
jgi:3-oxoacyl-[acyl-carrier protein] reductase